jgi:small subunit ribosomal protein S7
MRKGVAEKRPVVPDPVYNSVLVTRAINTIMYEGKKSLAQSIVYGALKLVEAKLKKPGVEVYNRALENVMPALELKVRRVGGANYQVPVEVPPERKLALGLR